MAAERRAPGAAEVEVPETFAEIRDAFVAQLYRDLKAGKLKGTALTQSLAHLAKLAESGAGRQAEPEPLIADVIGGVEDHRLSPLRKLEILVGERERMLLELAAMDVVIERCEVLVAAS